MKKFKYKPNYIEADQYLHGISKPDDTRFCHGNHGHLCPNGHDIEIINDKDWLIKIGKEYKIMKDEEFRELFEEVVDKI